VQQKYLRVSAEFLIGLDIESTDLGAGVAEVSLDTWKIALAERYYPESAIGKPR
jgi:hypothetical protein